MTTDRDHRIIDAVSVALGGHIGSDDDIERLKTEIVNGSSTDKLHTACEIAVAFIRFAQVLKSNNRQWERRHEAAYENAEKMTVEQLRMALANEQACAVFWQDKFNQAEARLSVHADH